MPSFRCQLLGRGAGGASSFFLRLGRVAQGAVLGASLGQAVAQLLHGAGVAIFALDQQGFQIDHIGSTMHRISVDEASLSSLQPAITAR